MLYAVSTELINAGSEVKSQMGREKVFEFDEKCPIEAQWPLHKSSQSTNFVVMCTFNPLHDTAPTLLGYVRHGGLCCYKGVRLGGCIGSGNLLLKLINRMACAYGLGDYWGKIR